MKRMIFLASAVALLVAASPAARAEDAAPSDADCNRVIKASAESDKKPSPKHLAKKLHLPLKTVNACLSKVRHSGSGTPPATAQ